MLGFRLSQLAKVCAPVQPAGCLVGDWLTSLFSQVGVLRGRERTFWRKWVFHLHGSTVSAGRRPSIFRARKIDECFTRKGGYFFGVAQFAFGSGCPAGLSEGRLQGHPGRAQNAKVVFGVGESTLFPESRCFAYTGAPALHTTLAVRPGQLAKLCAPVRPAGCLVGACSTSFVSQVGVLRRRERTF